MTEAEYEQQRVRNFDEIANQQLKLFNPATQVFFRAGWLACREYMARFVEAQDPAIAASIRANWWPSFGPDLGPPRLINWNELADGDEPPIRIKHPVSPTLEALPIALQIMQHVSGEGRSADSLSDGVSGG
jgi:hypothetical protein